MSYSTIELNERLACFTLDFEGDYGRWITPFKILDDHKTMQTFAHNIKSLNLPMSTFFVTQLLEQFPESSNLIESLSTDCHCHSHTHNFGNSVDSKSEINTSFSKFYDYFGSKPIGYRAPQGVLKSGDVDSILKCGFRFSSSVFPSLRPFVFNNLALPRKPFFYENGLIEIPFATLSKIRFVISISYIKIYGWKNFEKLLSFSELPNLLVIDSHLHDFFFNKKTYDTLPAKLRLVYRRNYNEGFTILYKLVNLLKTLEYRFVSMTEISSKIRDVNPKI